jgi:hypothetical protein
VPSHVACLVGGVLTLRGDFFFDFFLAVKKFLFENRYFFHYHFRGGAADQYVLSLVLGLLEVMWMYCTTATAVHWA